MAGAHPGRGLLPVSRRAGCDPEPVPFRCPDRCRPAAAVRQGHGRAHLWHRGHLGRCAQAGRSLRPERLAWRLARQEQGLQRGRDQPGDPPGQHQQQCRARVRRQRGAAARGSDARGADGLHRSRPCQGQAARRHGRDLEHLAAEPGTGQARGFYRDPSAALLGRARCGFGGAVLHPKPEAGRGPLPGQAGHHRRGRLALAGTHARERRGFRGQRSPVPAPLPGARRDWGLGLHHHHPRRVPLHPDPGRL